MLTVRILSEADEVLVRLEPVQVGGNARWSSPACCVTVFDGERPILRVDVFPYKEECYAFEEAIVWRGFVVIGFGGRVHLVGLADRSVRTFEAGRYFGHLYPTPEYLLIASSLNLQRLEPDGSLRWKSDWLGIDGVVVDAADEHTIRGKGEWDPPGGWREFVLSAGDGAEQPG